MAQQPRQRRRQAPEANELSIGQALRGEFPALPGLVGCFALDLFAGVAYVMKPIPRPGLDTPDDWELHPATDLDTTHVIEYLIQHRFTKVRRTHVDHSIDAEAARRKFNAPQKKLLALDAWDGEPRLERFWIDVCGAQAAEEGMSEDEIFNRTRYLYATARCFFIGVVARIMRPGCKLDTMVVLEGAQGTEKSSLLRVIAFDEDDWFSDSMPPNLSSRDARQHLNGRLIIEFPELHQFNVTRMDTLKAFLSARDDKFRKPYARRDEPHKRQCVMVGTTNEDEYLTDVTGNRRFWPIRCGKIDLTLARELMPQLFAEALVAYRDHQPWWLTPEMEKAAKIEQAERLEGRAWDGKAMWLKGEKNRAARIAGDSQFHITVDDLLDAIPVELARRTDQMHQNAGKILKSLQGVRVTLPRNSGWPKKGYRFPTTHQE